jgi:hypothetical protein
MNPKPWGHLVRHQSNAHCLPTLMGGTTASDTKPTSCSRAVKIGGASTEAIADGSKGLQQLSPPPPSGSVKEYRIQSRQVATPIHRALQKEVRH